MYLLNKYLDPEAADIAFPPPGFLAFFDFILLLMLRSTLQLESSLYFAKISFTNIFIYVDKHCM